MAIKFNWTCPYCGRHATITDSNYSLSTHYFDKDNKDSELCLTTEAKVCPNDECKEYAINAFLHTVGRDDDGYRTRGTKLQFWRLRPSSFATQFPDYVPEPIKQDYEEACLIRDLSPKASATLSRRCLQGMIRNFFGVSERTLFDEINAIRHIIDATTWQAINSVRSIGNIGAHMEKDINLVIDVDPKEAQLLINLIEILVKDWYVAEHERIRELRQITQVARDKSQEKKSDSGAQADAVSGT